MGCFLACFGSSKDQRRRRKPAKRVSPRAQKNRCSETVQSKFAQSEGTSTTLESTVPPNLEKPISPIRQQLKDDGLEEQLSFNTRKKVTFDLNVKTYEEVLIKEEQLTNYDEAKTDTDEEKGVKETRSASASENDSISSNLGSFPSNHRYQNCSNSDDEYEVESDGSDLDEDDDDDEYDGYSDVEDDDDGCIGEGESSESFFSLPSESRKQGSAATSLAEKEVNSPVVPSARPIDELKTLRSNQNTRNRSQYVYSVLNPVENLSQWKAVKAKSTPQLKHQKENLNLEQEPQIPFSSEPTFKPSVFSLKKNIDQNEPQQKQEIEVDASLSNWLGSTESTPSIKSTSNISIGIGSADGSKSQRSNSPRSLEDRPILGALTVEELKQFSASSSPRKSPSRSPDEMPILGTVGRYWSHTGQASDSSSTSSYKGIPNTTSKYREDKKVNWHSTPFQTRLERALNKDAAESS